MDRYRMVIGLKPETEQKYKEYHRGCVAGRACNDQQVQYSQLLHLPQESPLYAYFEYHGTNYAADIARMAEVKT